MNDNALISVDFLSHHLRLFGIGSLLISSRVSIFAYPDEQSTDAARMCVQRGAAVVVLMPQPGFLAGIGATEEYCAFPTTLFSIDDNTVSQFASLKTLHPYRTYKHSKGLSVLTTHDGQSVWLWISGSNGGGYLVIGTDVVSDLIRYRQGDPARAFSRPREAQWGIAGERPNYLFEQQLAGSSTCSRHADLWVSALVDTLSNKLHVRPAPILPGNAPGAVVITGDDDQAYLEKYDEQLNLLGDLPITYLLHPLTRHTRKTLRTIQVSNPGVDYGIHPDALDAPERYAQLFDEQVAWYRRLTGHYPVSLRNHGFLNDGYWGHLDAWLKHGVRISSNLPGFDGRVLNGSLLPARFASSQYLTTHWTVLTVLGDGMRFAAGMTDQEAAERVLAVAEQILQSSIPGVMVINLHPQNVSETRAMHLAVKEIVRGGFIGWNLKQCLDWFNEVDGCVSLQPSRKQPKLWIKHQWRRFGHFVDSRINDSIS